MKDQVKTSKKPAKTATGSYVKIASLIAAALIVVTLAGTFAAFPTQAHRDANTRMTAFSEQATRDGFNSKVFESKEYKDAMNSPETRYSVATGIVTTIIQAAVEVTFVGLTYNYLRKNFLSKTRRALGATVILNVAASMVAYLVTVPLVARISGVAMPEAGTIISTMVVTIVASLVLTFIVASVFESIYNRKHSFIVE